MTGQVRQKQERIIEAVRLGLEGDAAVDFVRKSGYAMTMSGIARHLRAMGGRAHVVNLIREGRSNVEILETCFPETDLGLLKRVPPTQSELFGEEITAHLDDSPVTLNTPLYDTAKVVLRLPADLYEAIRLAAKVEGKTQNQLIVDILTSALARMPAWPESEGE